MPATPGAKDDMLDAFAASAGFASLHSSFPGDTGAAEISGGVPPYARQVVTWNPANNGVLDDALSPLFNVPAGTTIQFLGLWDAAVAGNFRASVPLGGGTPVPFAATESDDLFRADSHGLANGNEVVLWDTTGAILPPGTVQATIYFIRDATIDTFKLAATSGGPAINITADGAGFVQTIVPDFFSGQGTYQVTAITLDLLR